MFPKKLLFGLLITVIIPININAQTFFARLDGDWDQTNRWSLASSGGPSCTCIPTVGSTVVIDGFTIDIDNGTGNVSVDSLLITNARNRDTQLRVQGGRTLTITDGLGIVSQNNRNRHTALSIENTATVNVIGETILGRPVGNSRNRRVAIRMRDNASMTTNGLLTILNQSSSNNQTRAEIELNNNATLTSSGGVSVRQDAGGDLRFELNNNSSWAITGDMNFDLNGGDHCDFFMDDASSLTISQDMLFDWDGATEDIEFHLSVSSSIAIARDFTVDMDGDDNISWFMDNNAGTDHFHVGRNFLIDHNLGLGVSFFLENNAEIDVDGDFTIDWDGASGNNNNIELSIPDNTLFIVDGSLDIDMNETVRSNCELLLDLDDDGVFSVGVNDGSLSESATINMIDGDYLNIDIDGDAQALIYGNLSMEYGGNTFFEYHINQHVNGVGADALFQIDGNWTITKTAGEGFEFLINRDANVNVGGNLTISTSGHDAGVFDDDEFIIGSNATLDVEGNFSYTINDANQENALHLTLEDDAQFDIGASSANNHTVNMLDGDELVINIDNNAIWNVNGNLNVVLTDSDTPARIEFNDISGNSAQLNITGNFDIDNVKNTDDFNITLHASSSLLNVDGNIDLSGAAAANRIEIELLSTSTIEIGGNFIRTGGFGVLDCNNNSTVEYNGTGAQIFAQDAGSGGDDFDYRNVIINNTFGTDPQVAMEGDAVVHTSLTLTDGIIASSTANMLSVADGATATSGSAASYVDGPLEKIGNDAFTFPVGDSSVWARLEMRNLNNFNNSTRFVCEYNRNPSPNELNLGAGIDHVSKIEYWDLSRVSDPGNNARCHARLYWENETTSAITSMADLTVANYNTATNLWDNHNGVGIDLGLNGRALTGIIVTRFNRLTLASRTGTNPLPIELLSFSAKAIENKVNLNWITSSEINNDFFTVERSSDAKHWEEIIIKNGAGNSHHTIEYVDVDYTPLSGVSYYRLKQVDFDGAYSYSDIVSIQFNGEITTQGNMSIYPNPVKGGNEINVKLDAFSGAEITVVLKDLLGKEITSKIATTIEKGAVIKLSINEKLSKGVYIVTATSNNKIYSKKLIIK